MLARNPGVRDLALTPMVLLAKQRRSQTGRFGPSHGQPGHVAAGSDARAGAHDRHADVVEASPPPSCRFPTEAQHRGDPGMNEDELVDMIEFGRRTRPSPVHRVHGRRRSHGWSAEQVVSQREILEVLSARYGPITPVTAADLSAPAERFRLSDGATFGIVASTTARSAVRAIAAGLPQMARVSMSLRAARNGSPRTATKRRQRRRAGGSDRIDVAGRSDRGAEERLALVNRAPLFQVEGLRAIHIEKCTRVEGEAGKWRFRVGRSMLRPTTYH